MTHVFRGRAPLSRSAKHVRGWGGAHLEVQDIVVKHLHAHGLRLGLLHQQPLVLVPGRAQRLLLILLQSMADVRIPAHTGRESTPTHALDQEHTASL